MRLLLDTHILVWLSIDVDRLPGHAVRLIEDTTNVIVFSVVSLWEVAIKRTIGRDRLDLEPAALRLGLRELGFQELPILAEHVLATRLLPHIHKDPFDRLLIAQATVENATLLTADARIALYSGPIRSI